MLTLKISDNYSCPFCGGTEIIHLYNLKGTCTYVCSDCGQIPTEYTPDLEVLKKRLSLIIVELDRVSQKIKDKKFFKAPELVFED